MVQAATRSNYTEGERRIFTAVDACRVLANLLQQATETR